MDKQQVARRTFLHQPSLVLFDINSILGQIPDGFILHLPEVLSNLAN